ncbi:MAG: hypothetical protein QNL88_01370, partial [Acidobacteriota bacterium]|nr:hypothetical protein [Acidobacteriota bacterium]
MEVGDLVEQIEQQAIIALDGEALPELLDVAEVIRADNTCVTGWIRILCIDRHFVVQEQTPEGEILIRRLTSR